MAPEPSIALSSIPIIFAATYLAAQAIASLHTRLRTGKMRHITPSERTLMTLFCALVVMYGLAFMAASIVPAWTSILITAYGLAFVLWRTSIAINDPTPFISIDPS